MSESILRKGRGATLNPQNRYEKNTRVEVDDGWDLLEEELPPLKTTVTIQQSRTIISRNDSPDIPYGQSINPYQGCEHGCIYCYARPSHAYLDLSPGVDFETKLFAKPNAAQMLREELAHPKYKCSLIVLGSNTDPYQPIEREWKVTRKILEVLLDCKHPVAIITKAARVEDDIDILSELAKYNLVRVNCSVTTLDHELARRLEPRATAPKRRLQAIENLANANIPVGVMAAPMIPALNDCDMEAILEAASNAGATTAGYTVVRLAYELKELFRDWLKQHYPLKAEHVMSIIQQMRGGKDYDSTFGQRMHGTGNFAELLEQRFQIACQRFGLNRERIPLATEHFQPPSLNGQMKLF
jgi:DNA repair photolyase